MPWNLATAIVASTLAAGALAAVVAHEAGGADPRAAFARADAIPFPPGNPYSPAKGELGRRLFFEVALSDDRTRSCASCHDAAKAWGDGLPRALGRAGAPLPVRTPTLLEPRVAGPVR